MPSFFLLFIYKILFFFHINKKKKWAFDQKARKPLILRTFLWSNPFSKVGKWSLFLTKMQLFYPFFQKFSSKNDQSPNKSGQWSNIFLKTGHDFHDKCRRSSSYLAFKSVKNSINLMTKSLEN